MRDEKRTLECLKKGVRIASQCLDTGVQVQIYVELLNHYLFYFERGNSLITVVMLNQVSPICISSLTRMFRLIVHFHLLRPVNIENQRRDTKSGAVRGIQAN